MSTWLPFSLLAPALYTVVLMLDKYIVEREVREYRLLPIYSAIVSFFFAASFWAISGYKLLSLVDGSIVIITGALTTWAGLLYYKAISLEQSSIIIALVQVQPVFVLVLSFLFLGERIDVKQLLGFVLILGSATALSIQSKDTEIRRDLPVSSAFFLILIADLVWAITGVLFKLVSKGNPFFLLASYESFGLALGGGLLYMSSAFIRHEFQRSLQKGRWRVFGIFGFSEGLYILAKLLQLFAITIGPVALVMVLGSTQVLYGFLLGTLLTVIAPSIFKEDISVKSLSNKLIWSLIMFAGVWLIQV